MADIIIPVSESSPGGIDSRARDANGNLITNQIGSQFWMNAGYQGVEPTLEVKQAFSTAEYASGWISDYANILIKEKVPVSTGVQKIATYPAGASPVLQELWKEYYALSPQAAYDQRNQETALAERAKSSVVTPITAAVTEGNNIVGQGDKTSSQGVNSIASTLGSYAMYILVGVIVIIAAAVIMAKTHIGGSSA